MPTATDRARLKQLHRGQFVTNNSASDPLGEVAEFHKRQRDVRKLGTENAATNMAETPALYVKRKSILRQLIGLVSANAATNNTNYAVINFYKRLGSNGGSQTLLASWNTHGGGQGTLTANLPGTFSLASSSNCVIAAGSVITYEVIKTSSGVAIPSDSVFVLDLEED